MEIIRLKKENSILEKKKKELLNQIHDLMTKNNSLNQEILSLRYSNKNSAVSHQSNNNTINELNKTISTLKSKINQITKEKSDLEKKNNELKMTINSYKNEKQKLLNNINNNNNKNSNLSEMKKINDILNKN
jgi:chromosome segregation ATPase